MTKSTAGKSRKTGTRRKEYTSPALEKGLDILELLAEEPQGLNISQLAKRQGRSVGQVFRMMAVLEQRGYIQLREDSDAYVITLKMFELSHRFPPVARLSAVAVPVMKKLALASGQSCHLAIYYEGRGHVVAQQDAPTERIFSVRLGAAAALMGSCSGHVLLAFADDETRASMLAQLPSHQKQPKSAEVKKLVERIRRQGNEVMKSAQVQGVEDIGFPVFDRSGQISAALVMPFVSYIDGSHSVSLLEATGLMAEAAGQISSELGFVA